MYMYVHVLAIHATLVVWSTGTTISCMYCTCTSRLYQ